LLLQPYQDGVSSRRTSLMAGLALGRPIVTTFGVLTESVWQEEGLVVGVPPGDPRALADALATLADDADARQRLGERARAGYQAHFSLERTITTLRAWANQSGRE
jgi:glycosyltransferase involved in cell wall biosynthesis